MSDILTTLFSGSESVSARIVTGENALAMRLQAAALKGDKGDTGDTGPQGIQGVQGEKGDKGDTGDTGPQGIQGEKGEKGDSGTQGLQGVQGEKGEKGDTGEGADFFNGYQNDLNLKLTKHLNVWNQTLAGLASCYWTWVMRVDDKLVNPLGKYYMWFSTDHAGDANQYIGLAYSDSLTDGWTLYGTVFRHYDADAEAYIGDETPSVIWDAGNSVFIMFSSGTGQINSGESQSTYRSVSSDGITWTGTSKAFTRLDGTRMPGNMHNGYFMPFNYMGSWFGYSLMGGANGGAAFHWSEDGGYTWYTDHRQLGRWALTNNSVWLYPNHSTVVFIRGQAYLLGVQSNFASGTEEKTSRITLTPMADLRTPVGRPYVLLEPSSGDATYEGADLRTVTVYAERGKLYVYYNCKVGSNWYNNCAVVETDMAVEVSGETASVSFTTQPVNASSTEGSVSGSLSAVAVASDSSAISYQWYSNTSLSNSGGSIVSGAASASMVIPTTLTSGTYYYYCVATAAGRTAASNAVTVTVSAAPTVSFTTQPSDASVTVGSISGSLSAVAAASDSSEVSYQWYSNETNSNSGGSIVSGAASSDMDIPTVLTAGTYYYYCVATSATAGTVASNAVSVTVGEVPSNYIAYYDVTGTANDAVPAAIADTGGNANADLIVNGVTAYNAYGSITIANSNESLYLSGLDLMGNTSYTIHLEYRGEMNSQHRLIHIPSLDLNLMVSVSTTKGVKLETATSGLGFTSPFWAEFTNDVGGIWNVKTLILDIAVTGDSVRFTGSTSNTDASVTSTFDNTATITGFSTALAQGVYIGNRAAGDRAFGGRITLFNITAD